MLGVVVSILNKDNLLNIKQSLTNMVPDIQWNTRVFCVASEDTYLEMREFIDSIFDSKINPDKHRSLVVLSNGDNPLTQVKTLLTSEEEFLFIMNENIIVPTGVVNELMADYGLNQSAGLISGHFTGYPVTYWVDNIYNPKNNLKSDEVKLINKLENIDTTPFYGVMTKLKQFRSFNFSKNSSIEYGLALRRAGFQNYLDTEIIYQYNNKKGGKE